MLTNQDEFTFTIWMDNEPLTNLFNSDIKTMQAMNRKRTKKCDEITVLFNPPATIIWKNGVKYVSKAHNEDFDEEKGLLMCLAKANGYTHRDIQKMIKTARREGKKEVK